jgi:hypothetical protein
MNLQAVSRHVIEKGTTPEFFLNRYQDRTVPADSKERTFTSPPFQSGVLLAQSVNHSMSVGVTNTVLIGHAPIRLTVLALAQGVDTSASAKSTNPLPAGSTPSAKKKSNKWIWIVVAAGGGAAVAALAMKKSSGDIAGPGGSSTTVTVGQPTVGAPQ